MLSVVESAEEGHGLYSFKEVAQYLRVNIKTLRSWFSNKDRTLLKGEIARGHKEGTWLSFDDLIQAYAVKSLKDKGIQPKVIREAIVEAQETYNLPYPLSMRGHEIFADDNGTLHILPPGESHPAQLTGRAKTQTSLKDIIASYLTPIEFDEKGMAARFVVFQKQYDGLTKRVVMDPHTNFGEPTVEGTMFRVVTLCDAAEAEGSPERAAELYEVDKRDVLVAIDLCRQGLALKAAA